MADDIEFEIFLDEDDPQIEFVFDETLNILNVTLDQTPNNGQYTLLEGVVDGVNKRFRVSKHIYDASKIAVFKRGVLQQQGSPAGDYTTVDAPTGYFDFNSAPIAGSIITAIYF
jgi:hypothetical protein